jgi:signal transduction histidine kinase
MDRDTLGRLFDRFYRQDASRAGGGSGIGLSIARRLAENHRWRLTASIPEPGLLRFTAEL